MLLFDRKIKIIYYTKTKVYTITDLFVNLDITCDEKPDPNKGIITIYNLGESLRKAFNDFYKIDVMVGYGNQLSSIYFADVLNIKHKKEEVNWITTIQALDGGKTYADAFFNKSYSKGASFALIITDLIKALGLPFELSVVPSAVLYANHTYSGLAKDILTTICKNNGWIWNIQHGVLHIFEKGKAPTSSMIKAVLLSADTGLVESPEITEDGVNFKSLMNPEIRPNRLVKLVPVNPGSFIGFKMVENRKGKAFNLASNGIFRAKKCRYSGNNMNGDFLVEAEGLKLV